MHLSREKNYFVEKSWKVFKWQKLSVNLMHAYWISHVRTSPSIITLHTGWLHVHASFMLWSGSPLCLYQPSILFALINDLSDLAYETRDENSLQYSSFINNYKFLILIFIYIPCILILSKFFFYLPTDAQVKCLKNNFKIYIKIDIKTAPTCFGAITIIRERIIRGC